jgi:hypothetical protein
MILTIILKSFAAIGVAFGLLMILKPALIIQLHIKTAAKSNWRTEPISMEKELRNMKFRGVILIALCILAVRVCQLVYVIR